MAHRFVRVHLSNQSRDFRPTAVEPGLALLDPVGANAKIVFRWLGGMAAEPEWISRDAVNFYARDDYGGRLEDVSCSPATPEELRTVLADDLRTIGERLAKAHPETPSEEVIHRIVSESFTDLTADMTRADLDDYFFKYRDAGGRLRLVWCYGYQRVDRQNAPAVICGEPLCNLLFLRRPGGSGKCPDCQAAIAAGERRGPRRKWPIVAGLAALLLLGLAAWWLLAPRLVATPDGWAGPVGSRVEFHLVRHHLWHRDDVTATAAAVIENPQLLRLDANALAATAISPGQTAVEFFWGDLHTRAKVSVGPVRKPDSIEVRPDRATLAVGGTVRLQAIAHYNQAAGPNSPAGEADVSSCVQWSDKNDGRVFACGGLVEAVGPGRSNVGARVVSPDGKDTIAGVCEITVNESQPKSLAARLDPPVVVVGRASRLAIDAFTADGARYDAGESSRLTVAVEPASAARVEGGLVVGQQAGKARLTAAWGQRKAELEFQVVLPEGPQELVVRPASMTMAVGEIGDVGVVAPPGAAPRLASSDTAVLEIGPNNRLLARSAGKAKVTVTQGGQSREVALTVHDLKWSGLEIDPFHVGVPLDDSVAVRVMGTLEDGRRAEVAPERLTTANSPSPRFAEFDPSLLRIRGIDPTTAKEPQTLAVDYGRLRASAPVEVILAPMQLELSPAGPIQLPAGQQVALEATGLFRGGQRRPVAADRLEWHVEAAGEKIAEVAGVAKGPLTPGPSPARGEGSNAPAAFVAKENPASAASVTPPLTQALSRGERGTLGSSSAIGPSSPALRFDAGTVTAVQAKGPALAVWAGYMDQKSNRVVIHAGEPGAVKLQLTADPPKPSPGQAGQVTLAAADAKGPVNLAPDLATFASSDDKVLAIDAKTGAFRAMAAGEAKITARHVGAREPGEVTITVPGESKPDAERPVAVRILSDQGQAVHMAVGLQFDDFRVEAEWADGVTQMVTRRATLRTSQPPAEAPLAAAGGQLNGLRPGQTVVQAEFNGVHSQQGLDVTVTAGVDADEIRVSPSPVTIRPGETVTLQAEGYKGGKSIGGLAGLGKVEWKSAAPDVVRAAGPVITGLQAGEGAVTAQLGPLVSQPARIKVGDTSEPLAVDPGLVRMRVGESRQIGRDVTVARGKLDVSDQCRVTPADSDIVTYEPETRSLRAVRAGVTPVTFATGDQTVTATVEVQAGPLSREALAHGEIVVEPARALLAPGQAVPLRVYVIDRNGYRYDRTDAAALTSSDAGCAAVQGNYAVAKAAGSATIAAAVPGVEGTGAAAVTVIDDKVDDLLVEPGSLTMAVGDRTQLRVQGRSGQGTYEILPQSGLKLTVGGPNPSAIGVDAAGRIDARSPGQAEINVAWNGLQRTVPVSVVGGGWSDLRIQPAVTSIESGDRVDYEVTAVRGGQRRVVGAVDGLTLSVDRPAVARVTSQASQSVRGLSPGQTAVVAQLSGQQAEASLSVVPAGSSLVLHDRRGRTVVGGRGHRVVTADDVIVDYNDIVSAPAAGVADLQFVPDVLRLPMGSPGASTRIYERLADGTLGHDITHDPALELTRPGDVATIEETSAGAVFHPVRPGTTRVAARRGTQTAVPLLVEVGGSAAVGTAVLEVSPDPLLLWPGQSGGLASVRIVPALGAAAINAGYRLEAPAGSGVVAVESGNRVHALAPGSATVAVVVESPAAYRGVSTNVLVQVEGPDRLTIDPRAVTLEVGQTTPRLRVLAQNGEGAAYEVPAALESSDPHVVAPAAGGAGRFVAGEFGTTQIRASYRGREAFATVTVTGKRFQAVNSTLHEGSRDFDVALEVLAAPTEGPLEYRLYEAGQTPPAAWQPAARAGEFNRVVLTSPRLAYGGRDTQYRLMIEARDPAGKVQQYPFTFRLASNIQRTE